MPASELTVLERELLGLLVGAGGVGGIPGLFEGLSPRWALEAVGRLAGRGFVATDGDADAAGEVADAVYRVTPAGRAALAASPPPAPRAPARPTPVTPAAPPPGGYGPGRGHRLNPFPGGPRRGA